MHKCYSCKDSGWVVKEKKRRYQTYDTEKRRMVWRESEGLYTYASRCSCSVVNKVGGVKYEKYSAVDYRAELPKDWE